MSPTLTSVWREVRATSMPISVSRKDVLTVGNFTGQTEDKSLTEFVQPILTAKKVAFCQKALEFTSSIRASISAVAGRPPVDEAQMPSIMDSL